MCSVLFCFKAYPNTWQGLSRWRCGKASACNPGDARDRGTIPGSGRFPGEGNGNPLQYSCLENSMDRGAWWATPMGLQSVRYKQAHTHTHTNTWQANYMSSSNSFIFSLTHHLLWKLQLLNVNSNDNFE